MLLRLFLTSPVVIVGIYFLLRLVSKTSLLFIAKKWWRLLEDSCHVFQFYKIPKFNDHMQENQLYTKVVTYLNSLSSVEDSNYANLFTGNKSNDITIVLDSDQVVTDTFLSARVYWTNEKSKTGSDTLVLKIRRRDKRRILRPYIQHIHTVFDEFEQRRKEVKLYINAETQPERNGRWISVPFTHPSTIETTVIDADLKNKVKSDLEAFLNCGEERVMVFTMNSKDRVDPAVLRPGRIDVHIQFPLCDFSAFKNLANSHLGLKEHKLFPQVEEIFQSGVSLSPAEIGEIMISNRSSPTRALKSVITAMQSNMAARVVNKIPRSASARVGMEESGESAGLYSESVHTVREFRKLYGLFRSKSSRKESMDVDLQDKDYQRQSS
uniref:Uncharacterized protein n=1 Tax=Daucus carota subsp. sativus TaxID=79200 RepID=A0A161XYK4_DAUCS